MGEVNCPGVCCGAAAPEVWQRLQDRGDLPSWCNCPDCLAWLEVADID